ncbi:hypothetical protein ABK040_010794 [Willaertia magna]
MSSWRRKIGSLNNATTSAAAAIQKQQQQINKTLNVNKGRLNNNIVSPVSNVLTPNTTGQQSRNNQTAEQHQLQLLTMKLNQNAKTIIDDDDDDEFQIGYRPKTFATKIKEIDSQFYQEEEDGKINSQKQSSQVDIISDMLSQTLQTNNKEIIYSFSSDSDNVTVDKVIEEKILTPKEKKKNKKVISSQKDDDLTEDEDFDKYFGNNDKLSLSLSSKKNSSKKKKNNEKIIKKRKVKSNNNILQPSLEDDSSLGEIDDVLLNYDEEDSQKLLKELQQYKSSSQQQISPPKSTTKEKTKEKKSTKKKGMSSSSSSYLSQIQQVVSSTKETPSKPTKRTAKKSSSRKSSSFQLQLPEDVEDDIDDNFSDDDFSLQKQSVLPAPSSAVLGNNNASLFLNNHSLAMNQNMMNSYLTQQQQVMNNKVNESDLILTDSEDEGNNDSTIAKSTGTSTLPTNTTNHLLSHPNNSSLSLHLTSSSPQRNRSLTNQNVPKKNNNNLVFFPEDGYDLANRLHDIKKTVPLPKESEVHRLLNDRFNTPKRNNIQSTDIIEDEENNDGNDILPQIEDQQPHLTPPLSQNNNSHPSTPKLSQTASGESWLSKLRNRKQNIPLSQQSSVATKENTMHKWEHLTKILSLRSTTGYVGKLKRAVQSVSGERLFTKHFKDYIDSAEETNQEKLTLKVLILNHPHNSPHLISCICKIVENCSALENQEYVDIYFTTEMYEKLNLKIGSLVEILPPFHISHVPSDLEIVYRPRPVVTYFFELKAKNVKEIDENSLLNEVNELIEKFTSTMLSHQVEEEEEPKTPTRMEDEDDDRMNILQTPQYIRKKNIIKTPKKGRSNALTSDDMDGLSLSEDFNKSLSINQTMPKVEDFNHIYHLLHSSYFPSYLLNIEGVIQRVWSFDHILRNEYGVSMPDGNISNTILIQCVKTKQIIVLLLPSGDSEYHYWKNVFDFQFSSGKLFQFQYISFKDLAYISSEEPLYSIIAPLSSQMDEDGCDSSLPIPVYFMTYTLHSCYKLFDPKTNNYFVHDAISEDIDIANHKLHHCYEQPITGETQSSMTLDEDVTNIHRTDIIGHIVYVRKVENEIEDYIQIEEDTQMNEERQKPKYVVYILQKHSTILLKCFIYQTNPNGMLIKLCKELQNRKLEIVFQNILVKRNKTLNQEELIIDKFSIAYLVKEVDEEENEELGLINLVKPRNNTKKKNTKSIEYEITCTLHSIGYVEGVISSIVEREDQGPAIPVCPECLAHISVDYLNRYMNFRQEDEQFTCPCCFSEFTEPKYELSFDVCIGNYIFITIDSKALNKMFPKAKMITKGNETYEQAKKIVLSQSLKFPCFCKREEKKKEGTFYYFDVLNHLVH